MRIVALGLALYLSGCASGFQSCVRVKDLTQQEQAALGNAIATLPADSPIVAAMGDYKRMRDEARICHTITR